MLAMAKQKRIESSPIFLPRCTPLFVTAWLAVRYNGLRFARVQVRLSILLSGMLIMTRLQLVVVLACSSIVCTTAHAVDWAQWRGPQRDGRSSETGLLKQWPAAGPKLLWQTNDLGGGYSTPSVAAGQLYVICNKDGESEHLTCLSMADGKQLWSTRIGGVGKNNGPQYPGSRSTPTVDGNSVYALASDGELVCLDTKSGKLEWSKNLPRDFNGQPGSWAYSESPLIDGDGLLCSPGGASATVVMLKKSDGSTIWKSALPEADSASYSSPVIATIDGTKQYILFLSKGVVGLDAKTGQPLWRYAKTSDQQANIQTPVTKDNMVYTAASRVGGALVKVGGSKSQPDEVYFEKTMPSGIGGSVLVDGNLFGSSGSTVMCTDYATGKVKWQDRSVGAASLCYADGKLFLHGDGNNEIAMIAATGDKYQELGRFTPPNAPDHGRSKAWAYPIVVDGKLVFRDVGTIWCYDIKNP
jgi:outer membrane protein assembly factor BamB